MRWRHVLYAFLFSFLFGGMYALAGQTVADTLRVTVEGDLAGVTYESFEVSTRINDTVTYVAQAFDSEGDPVTATYVYASSDTTIVQIHPTTGVAVMLRKGIVDIWVEATVGSVMHVASFFPPDSLNWEGGDIFLNIWEPSLGDSTWVENPELPDGGFWYMDHILVPNPNPTLQYCAYLVDYQGFLVGESPGQPRCPIVFPIRPSEHPVFAGIHPTARIIDLRSFAGQG